MEASTLLFTGVAQTKEHHWVTPVGTLVQIQPPVPEPGWRVSSPIQAHHRCNGCTPGDRKQWVQFLHDVSVGDKAGRLRSSHGGIALPPDCPLMSWHGVPSALRVAPAAGVRFPNAAIWRNSTPYRYNPEDRIFGPYGTGTPSPGAVF